MGILDWLGQLFGSGPKEEERPIEQPRPSEPVSTMEEAGVTPEDAPEVAGAVPEPPSAPPTMSEPGSESPAVPKPPPSAQG